MLHGKSLPRHDSDFVSHLEELRRRLIVCLLTFGFAAAVAYFFSGDILDFLIEPLRRHQATELFFHKPYEAFLTHLKVAALTGIIVSSPVLMTQIWLFVAPGLYLHEKRILTALIFFSVLMFVAGAAFAYWIVIPWGLHFLLSFQTEALRPLLGVGPYFGFLTGMMLALGILFDFPVLILGLVRLGILSAATLAGARKMAVVSIFILAAILTPSPDPFSQLLMALPLLALFEFSVALARWMEGRTPPRSGPRVDTPSN